MFINYDAILDRKREFDDKTAARKHKLQLDAEEFLEQLKVSLQLPQHVPIDPSGTSLFYVGSCIKNANGFVSTPISALQLDEDYVLSFYVGLLINSNVIGGEWIFVPVELRYENSNLIFSAGQKYSHIEILPNPSPNRFLDALDHFKQYCIDEVSDENLE